MAPLVEMIVLDANILIRAVLGGCVRQLVETYAPRGVKFFASDVCFDDAEKYVPDLLKKRGRPHADVSATLEYLRNVISPVYGDLYGAFEDEAANVCADETKAIGNIATALELFCPLERKRQLLEMGIAVWTTDRVEIVPRMRTEAEQPDARVGADHLALDVSDQGACCA